MFGRSPRLPIDSMFYIEPDEEEQTMQISCRKYAEEWERGMNQAFEIAKTHAKTSGERNRNFYNKVCVDIEIGDRVLLKNLSERWYWKDEIVLGR